MDTNRNYFYSVGYHILREMVCRALTFFLHIFIVRRTNPSFLALQTIHLYLVYTSVVYLSREGLRKATQRFPNYSPSPYFFSPLVWVIFVSFSCSVSLVVYSYFLWTASPFLFTEEIHYLLSIKIVICASLLEILSEPVLIQLSFVDKPYFRFLAEMTATFVRNGVIYFLFWYYSLHLLAFAYGQLAYSISLCLVYYTLYYIYFPKPVPPPLDLENTSNPTFPAEFWTSYFLFSGQSILNLITTEGEKFLLIFLQMDLVEQGFYSLVNNLGSFVARFVFVPLEETYVHSSLKDSFFNFLLLFKFMSMIGLFFLTFGFHYTSIVIYLLYGERYMQTDIPDLLSWYCIYLFFLAPNGVTDIYAFSLRNLKQVKYASVWLSVFSVVHLLLCFLFSSYGAKGLFFANCLSKLFRLVYNLHFLFCTQKDTSTTIYLLALLPSFRTIGFCLFSFLLCSLSCFSLQYANNRESDFVNLLGHVTIGGICMILFIKLAIKEIYLLESSFEKKTS